MTEIFRPPFFQPDSINGVPLAGALLYFYQAETSTAIDTYQDYDLTTLHAWPVVADASGIFPDIYLDTVLYKTVLKTAAGVTVKTTDNINATSNDPGVDAAHLAADLAKIPSRNMILNGDFDHLRRGTSFTASGMIAEHWRMALGTSAAITVTYPAFTVGQTAVPGNPKNYMRAVRGTAGSTDSIFSTNIKDVTLTAAGTFSLVFWAKADAATTIRTRGAQNFGSGGSPSASVNGSDGTHSLTTTWTKFEHVITYASISGKTLGTNTNLGNHRTRLEWQWAAASNPTGTVEIAHVCHNPGDVTETLEDDPFTKLPWEEERMRLMHFFFSTFPEGVTPVQNVGSTNGAYRFTQISAASVTQKAAGFRMPVLMNLPSGGGSLVSYNPSATGVEVRNNTITDDCSAFSGGVLADRITFDFTNAAASAAGNELTVHLTVDADYSS